MAFKNRYICNPDFFRKKLRHIAQIRKKLVVFCLVVFTIQQVEVKAQSILKQGTLQLNTITTAVPFLLISPDSRSGGMGDVGVAISPDVNAIHWNASKLAFVEKDMAVGVSYTPWLRQLVNDINLSYLSGYKRMSDLMVIGGALRYFSLGEITFTNQNGQTIGQFRPNEFSVDVAGAFKFNKYFSGGATMRYIYSNLTGGITVLGSGTKVGNSFAVDISGYFTNPDIKLGDKDGVFSAGINISNLGAKISYVANANKNFLPANLRIGQTTKIELDDYNTIAFSTDFNKLLVPTPPEYALDSTGLPIIDPTTGKPEIAKGKDPNVSVAQAVFQSFTDAPGGFKEELHEINISAGMEYWYDNRFAVRSGYFYEHITKGYRQYLNFGLGLRLNVFGIDLSYLVSTTKNNPLANTVRFTLTFNFAGVKDDADSQ